MPSSPAELTNGHAKTWIYRPLHQATAKPTITSHNAGYWYKHTDISETSRLADKRLCAPVLDGSRGNGPSCASAAPVCSTSSHWAEEPRKQDWGLIRAGKSSLRSQFLSNSQQESTQNGDKESLIVGLFAPSTAVSAKNPSWKLITRCYLPLTETSPHLWDS